MATIEQPPVISPPEAPLTTNGRWTAYLRLLQMRMLEMWREPEVIFWVFVFPHAAGVGAGYRFRGKPPDVSRARDCGWSEGAANVGVARSLSPTSGSVHAEVLPAGDAFNQFRLGKYDLVITPRGSGGFEYRYDPARPESVLARTQVDDALQAAAGRKDPVAHFQPGVERAGRTVYRLS